MEMRRLGRTDINVSLCCLGTMTWGEQNTEADGHAQIEAAFDAGVNFMDTAELYSIPPKPDTTGSTETVIGSWFKKTGRRKDWILATKIVGRSPMTWFRDDGSGTRHTRAQIDEAVEKSLRRLQTDYIDLYQMHWPDRAVPVFGTHVHRDYPNDFEAFEEILGHLQRHVEKGSIRHVGVSNETPWGVMKFLSAAEGRQLPRIASIQNAYNPINRTFEYGLSEIAVQENVGLLAYSPLGQGYLTGKYQNGALPNGSRKALFQRLQRYEGPGADVAISAFLDLSAEIGWSPEEVALAFCASRSFTTSVIIGATNPGQLATNLGAFHKKWSPEYEKMLDGFHVNHRNPCP
jgi:aryl-alcohol dehydrogenase-like predicted oxidoreductase